MTSRGNREQKQGGKSFLSLRGLLELCRPTFYLWISNRGLDFLSYLTHRLYKLEIDSLRSTLWMTLRYDDSHVNLTNSCRTVLLNTTHTEAMRTVPLNNTHSN